MEQKQSENEEYLKKKKVEIAELKKENKELKARLQELRLKIEEKKVQDLKSDVNIEKSLNERINSLQTSMKGLLQFQTVMEQTVLLTNGSANRKFNNIQNNFDTKLINISTKLETLERALMNKLDEKEDRKPTILVLGGDKSNKMHLLNRDRTQWSTFSLKLPLFLKRGGAVYLDGEIYIFCGWRLNKETYKLDREMKWIQLADMNEERGSIINNSVVFDGCIWVFGGWNSSEQELNSVEMYKPEENKWIRMPSMEEKRQYAAAAACKGMLFVCGGYNGDRTLRSMECFDPTNQIWTMFLDLPAPTWHHALISDGTCLTVLGGKGEEKSVWKINSNEENASWRKLPQMRERRRVFTANLLGDNIFAGEGNERKVEVFNGETWKDGPELPEEIEDMFSIVIPAHLAAALESHQ